MPTHSPTPPSFMVGQDRRTRFASSHQQPKICLQAHTAGLCEPPSVNSTGNPCPWLLPHAVTLMETCLWAGLLQNRRPVSKLRRPKDEQGLKLSEISQVLKAHNAPFVVPNFQLHSTSEVATKQPVKAIDPVPKTSKIALLFCTCYLGPKSMFLVI